MLVKNKACTEAYPMLFENGALLWNPIDYIERWCTHIKTYDSVEDGLRGLFDCSNCTKTTFKYFK